MAVAPLRLAVVGLGRMGAFHARTLAASGDPVVVAVADIRPEAVAAGAELVPAARRHASIPDLVADGRVEAWLVATSTPSHPEIVRAALAAGLPVLCEKPLALDPDEGEALGAAAAAVGRVLQVGFWRRFSPPWRIGRDLIQRGAIGRPLLVRLSQWDADPPPAAFCDPAVSGGLAVDCGVHELDLAEWLTGLRIERVLGRHLPLVDASLASVGDVDNLLALLDLEGGVAATVDLSRNARYGDDVRTEVLGSEGALLIDMLPTARTRLADRSGVRVVPGSEVDDAMAAGVVAQAAAFARAVRGEDVDVPGAAASTRAVRAAAAITASVRTGEPVTLAAG